MRRACRSKPFTSLVAAVCVCVPLAAAQAPAPAPAPARQPAAARQPVAPAAAPAPASAQRTMVIPDERDAEEIRREFQRVLEKHPPALRRVLKLDPSLLQNPDYLAAYPALAGYLAQYPEVARDPAFFLSWVHVDDDERPLDARAQAIRIWENMFEAISVLVVMVTIIGALMWLIRSMIDYRRWSRLSRLQQDVHTKILDRFTSNDDLLAYMRTTPGQRFLESAPIALDGDAKPLAAPVRRILWSVQAGLVLLALGVGLQFVAARVPDDMSAPMATLGVLAIALGLGFGASAVAALVLSRRLGLLTPDHPAAVQEPAPRA